VAYLVMLIGLLRNDETTKQSRRRCLVFCFSDDPEVAEARIVSTGYLSPRDVDLSLYVDIFV
jgi:hypothetical protein